MFWLLQEMLYTHTSRSRSPCSARAVWSLKSQCCAAQPHTGVWHPRGCCLFSTLCQLVRPHAHCHRSSLSQVPTLSRRRWHTHKPDNSLHALDQGRVHILTARAGARLEVQALDELGRAQRVRQVVLVAQHQQRNAGQARLGQQVVQLTVRVPSKYSAHGRTQ